MQFDGDQRSATNPIVFIVCIDGRRMDERPCGVLFLSFRRFAKKKFPLKKILSRHTSLYGLRMVGRIVSGGDVRRVGRGRHQFDWPRKNAAPPCARSPSRAVRSKCPPPHARPGGPRPDGKYSAATLGHTGAVVLRILYAAGSALLFGETRSPWHTADACIRLDDRSDRSKATTKKKKKKKGTYSKASLAVAHSRRHTIRLWYLAIVREFLEFFLFHDNRCALMHVHLYLKTYVDYSLNLKN